MLVTVITLLIAALLGVGLVHLARCAPGHRDGSHAGRNGSQQAGQGAGARVARFDDAVGEIMGVHHG